MDAPGCNDARAASMDSVKSPIKTTIPRSGWEKLQNELLQPKQENLEKGQEKGDYLSTNSTCETHDLGWHAASADAGPESQGAVGGAVALFKRFKKRKQGKRAGALVKLRQRGFRMVLPSIHLANLRSLPNKMDELLLLSRINKDFSNSAALYFTESWLNDAIPDNTLNLLGFQLFRAVTESAGKSLGSRDMLLHQRKVVYRCNSVEEDVCPDLEAFFINCKPFYSPWEFSSFILVVKTTPGSQLLNLLSVSRLITVLDEADDSSVVHELQELDRWISRGAVIGVKGEEQWGEDATMGGASAGGMAV
ncbi:hypothetical protein QTP86_002723 [Hemibagrus guttatus]|nr:hypothetical protein QTP86_002723 [Hemibagrus guttatus]